MIYVFHVPPPPYHTHLRSHIVDTGLYPPSHTIARISHHQPVSLSRKDPATTSALPHLTVTWLSHANPSVLRIDVTILGGIPELFQVPSQRVKFLSQHFILTPGLKPSVF